MKQGWLWLLGSAFLVSAGFSLFSQIQKRKEREIYEKTLKIKEKEVSKANRELKKYSKPIHSYFSVLWPLLQTA